MSVAVEESAGLDGLDTRIIRSLQLAPRAPFRLLAELLETSKQTVARRYRRLRRAGLIRVTAVINPTSFGQSNWFVRLQCKPSGASSLAQALAQRDDVGWVTVLSGGTEVTCVIRSRTAAAREELMLHRLPRTAPVLGMTASMVLHHFAGGTVEEWSEFTDRLDPQLEARLIASPDAEFGPMRTIPRTMGERVALEPGDVAMLDQLVADGRVPYSALAAAAGTTEGRATRRMRQLLHAGAAYLDVDLPVAAFGFRSQAALWLRVTPSAVERVGQALRDRHEVPFAAAVTGPHNMYASVICRDIDALYAFTTDAIGGMDGVQTLEIAPVIQVVKQAGALVAGDRLAV